MRELQVTQQSPLSHIVVHCAHHTLGRAVTGDDPRYIVASCHACNLHIGDPARGADPPNEGVTRW